MHPGFRRQVAHGHRSQFIVTPHHPDRLRRPLPGLASENEAFRQALSWNIFRTLELIAPPFWLRRLHFRLTGEASFLAPLVMSVRLWPALPLPPIQQIDGRRPDVVADIVIESEHDVWTLLVPAQHAGSDISMAAADLVDAGGWLAGRRSHHCGVIECAGDETGAGALLKARYGRSRASASLRSASRGPAAPGATTWGALSWRDLAAVLEDCAGAHNLSLIERVLARHAVDWLQSAGIEPAD